MKTLILRKKGHMMEIQILAALFGLLSCNLTKEEPMKTFKSFTPPLSYEQADSIAGELLSKMTIDEKIEMIGGHHMFYTFGVERLGIPPLLMSDATQGIRMLPHIKEKIGKSVAFPCPILLSSTWNPSLAYNYAKSIGEECRAANISILLGPGVNIYRVSQNGRNFEYFGEDPYLAARMVENYIVGLQETGTIATLKHFMCNNHEYHRRTTNVIVDERTLHEIYLPVFKAGIDAGAMAVMTAYNQINGEYCGQSKYVITDILRNELGFKWLVMSDWWSTFDPIKTINSGLDLEMPGHTIEESPAIKALGDPYLRTNAKKLLNDGKITEQQIDRMVRSILRTSVAMQLYDRKADTSYMAKFSDHEKVALETAREGVVLLKNNGILPLAGKKKIIITGDNANKLPYGLGSAMVEGYNHVTLRQAMENIFKEKVVYVEHPLDDEIKQADAVVINIGTIDSEGFDRPFDLPDEINQTILHATSINPNVILVINTGGGINMTPWIDKVAAIVYAWYPGQIGNQAVAEILAGQVNPSGKLPISIEKQFSDSPGYGYIPEGSTMENNWNNDLNIKLPITNVEYKEGILVGYRWYDTKNIEPLFPFGHGLSYTTFEYNNLNCNDKLKKTEEKFEVNLSIKNTGKVKGAEIVQLYIRDPESAVIRPIKELKGFKKIWLNPGEQKTITIMLNRNDFAYWDPSIKSWKVEPGKFILMVGSSSRDIRLQKEIEVE